MALNGASRRMLERLQDGDTVQAIVTLTCSQRWSGANKTFDIGCNQFSVTNLAVYADSVSVVNRQVEAHPLDEAEPREVWEAFYRDVRMIFLVPFEEDLLIRISPRPETLDRAWWQKRAKRWKRITDEELSLA